MDDYDADFQLENQADEVVEKPVRDMAGVVYYVACVSNSKRNPMNHNRGPFSTKQLAVAAINSNYKSFDVKNGLLWSYEIISKPKRYISEDDMEKLDKDTRGFPYGIS